MPIPETHIPREATVVVAPSDSLSLSADYVCDGTNDEVEIQAAIDVANGGIVQLLDGSFSVSDLAVNNCTLRGQGEGTVLNVTGTITVGMGAIICGRLHNVKVATGGAFAGTAVKVDGGDGTNRIENISKVLDDIWIIGSAATGTGLLIEALATDVAHISAVSVSTFGSIHIERYEYTLRIHTNVTAGSAYVNGNVFESLVLLWGVYIFTLDCDGSSSITGNSFPALQMNAVGATTVDGITLDSAGATAAIEYNSFTNIMIWDWGLATGDSVQTTATTNNNYLEGYLGAEAVIDDLGSKNILINTRWSNARLQWQSPATIVVAASDSLNKAIANYVCDGTADDVEINAALVAGASGKVILLEGNYQITDNLEVPASTHFSGMGKGTILTTTDAVGITNMVVITGSNVTISDMKLVLGAGAGDATTRPNVIYASGKTLIWLENLWIVGDTTVADDGSSDKQDGICFITCTYSKVVNCQIQTNRRHSIYLGPASNYNAIMGNTIQGDVSYGIYLVTASNNALTENTCEGGGNHNIYLLRCSYCVITSNRCLDTTGGGGIRITGDGAGNSDYNIITGNVCTGNTTIGIEIVGGTDANGNLIKANITLGNTGRGVVDAGTNTIFDQVMHSIALNLIGGAADIEVFFAKCPCILAGYITLYSVATGAGAGVNIRVGRYQSGVALDDDYFDVSVSETNKAKGYSKHFVSADLTQTVIAAGDTITVGTAGGKADTGEVILILEIAEIAD